MEFVNVVFFVVGVILGLIIGFVSSSFLHKRFENSAHLFVLLVIALVWLGSSLLSWVDRSYETPLSLHGFMGLVVGFYFKPMFKK